ncbi:MAG: tRNA (N(6)-L-threonylcarbamoyladenosine(37)-C(2))-methylthiotransferase MtaB [Clostridia bacterium]|nr:tRNA (N(6)-L-threonylcarbamoyladenosine(37)-C(2))-methylthiotransferase MtaB [Clostridia bacterium]MBQ9957510.1 tRNA (N(6)-L-threonylcarbamoyladenosine(37)-C(2))-methylthiotransferase MtaB [Clostridia bacterium]
MTFAFYTLGCKVNQYETAAMERMLVAAGYTPTLSDAQPDIFIINSCTVTAESDRKTRQTVRKYRRELPNSVIVLTGCMPQAFPDDGAKIDAADIVLGNHSNNRLCEAIANFLETNKRVVMIDEHKKGDLFDTPPIDKIEERTRAYLKIQDGCNRFCSYCIIPTARGRERSKPLEDIKSEVSSIAKMGHKEIVLVGINLSAYGNDIEATLCDAVDVVCAVDGIERVRLGSLEPDIFTDEMMTRLKNQPKFCPQFHFSLQSGCDQTLKRMNRHYDTEFYRNLIKRVRSNFDNAAITTDIMVGFAGESEDEFEQSLGFAREIGFARAHIFAYSRRTGTVAARAKNQVTNAEKHARSQKMIAVTKESETAFLKSQVGKVCSVLFETKRGNLNEGYTKNYTYVKVDSPDDLCGEIRDVRISNTADDYCIGELV